MTIAFFSQNYTVGGVTGLLRTLSVYRIYGASVISSISGVISSINGLVSNAGLTSPNADFSNTASTSGYIYYTLNVTNIIANPPNNTFAYGYSRTAPTYGLSFGAGITITSLYYNLFSSSTLAFEKPPTNTA
jgi:hypothetical protein